VCYRGVDVWCLGFAVIKEKKYIRLTISAIGSGNQTSNYVLKPFLYLLKWSFNAALIFMKICRSTLAQTLFVTFLVLYALSLSAQQNLGGYNSADTFNGFQRTKAKYPDSAMVYLQKASLNNPEMLASLLHNSFAQSFLLLDSAQLSSDPEYLAKLKTANVSFKDALVEIRRYRATARLLLKNVQASEDLNIHQQASGLSMWVEAQDASNDPQKLALISDAFLRHFQVSKDAYTTRNARYGFLIANLMYAHAQLRPAANEILEVIYDNLQANQIAGDASTVSAVDRDRRAWYRYLFAYNNFALAQVREISVDRKRALLKTAAEYSPDAIDRKVYPAYFYDMYFLFGKEKPSFEEDYLAALSTSEDKFKQVLAMSMKDPFYKAAAKSLYKDSSNFSQYWLNEFNKVAKTAPRFALRQIDGTKYDLAANKEKWTLIDFWGTWCAPCRKEHPELQSMYLKTKDGQLSNLNVITIASRDTEQNVQTYFNEFKYSFPVIMSDKNIEKLYNVSSWPSKFLVSPQGKYVEIPFGADWEKYIADYIR
jgi:thiol-disulfide isomerase/thioredoxin